MADPKPKYWNVTAAACETGWSESQLYALPIDGTMKVRRGRRVKFHIGELKHFTGLPDKADQDKFLKTILLEKRKSA